MGGRTVEITTHRAEAYHPDSRKPDVRVRRRRRGRPVPAGLHGQRHGPVAAGHDADRPLRRRGRPGRRPAAHAAGRRGVLHRRPAADAARRPVHRRLRPGARRRPGGRGQAAARPPRDRVGRADPRRAGQAAGRRRPRRPACGSWSTPAWPRSSCPSCRPWPSSRTPSTATRTCWPTPSPWWRRPRRRTGIAAPGRPVPRRRQAQDPVVRSEGRRDVPPPRGGRRPHDPRPHAGAALLRRRHRDGHAGWSSSTCGSTPTAWGGPTAPCAATSATPARCSTGSTS